MRVRSRRMNVCSNALVLQLVSSYSDVVTSAHTPRSIYRALSFLLVVKCEDSILFSSLSFLVLPCVLSTPNGARADDVTGTRDKMAVDTHPIAMPTDVLHLLHFSRLMVRVSKVSHLFVPLLSVSSVV